MLPEKQWRRLDVDEIWLDNSGNIVVLGTPPDEPEEAHDCDYMGCGQCHVLVRAAAHYSDRLYQSLLSEPDHDAVALRVRDVSELRLTIWNKLETQGA